MDAFIDASARCEADSVGPGSRVLAYASVAPGVTIGRDCVIHDHAVLVGAVALEDGVDVGAGAVVGRERLLADTSRGPDPVGIIVRRLASIGANATVLPGAVIGRGAVVEPGSVVTENVPANAVVRGNPATIVAYVEATRETGGREVLLPSAAGLGTTETRVPGVTLHRLISARDLRGSLTAAEFSGLPFPPRRIFVVYDVPSESVRGAHAHRECSQFLLCMAGALSCLVDDGSAREEVRLEGSDVGLHIPPMIWGTQWKYSRDAVLLVLASHSYDPNDYIRDYEEFLELLPGGASYRDR